MYDGYCTYSIPDTGYTEKNPPAECNPNADFTSVFTDNSSTTEQKIDSCSRRIIDETGETLSASVTCVGTPDACNAINDEPTCTAAPGCAYASEACTGTRTPCADLTDGSLCTANTGCTMTSAEQSQCESERDTEGAKECIFLSSRCDQHAENQSSCNAEPGCFYQGEIAASAATCTGSPDACNAINDEPTCTAAPGCSHDGTSCTGTRTQCEGLTSTEGVCTANAGCTYTPPVTTTGATCRPLEEGDKIVSYNHLSNSFKCNDSVNYSGSVELHYSRINPDQTRTIEGSMSVDNFNQLCQADNQAPTHELTLGGCEYQEAQVIESETCGSAFTRMTREGTVGTACGARGWKYNDANTREDYSGILDEIPCGHGEDQQCLPPGDSEGLRIFETACCKGRQPCYTYDGTQAPTASPKKTCADIQSNDDGIPTHINKVVPTGFSSTDVNSFNDVQDPLTGETISWSAFDQQLCQNEVCDMNLAADQEACCTEPGRCSLQIESLNEQYNMSEIISAIYPNDPDGEARLCGEGNIYNNISDKMKQLPLSFDLEDACADSYNLNDRSRRCEPNALLGFFGNTPGSITLANTVDPTATGAAATGAAATGSAATGAAATGAAATGDDDHWYDIFSDDP